MTPVPDTSRSILSEPRSIHSVVVLGDGRTKEVKEGRDRPRSGSEGGEREPGPPITLLCALSSAGEGPHRSNSFGWIHVTRNDTSWTALWTNGEHYHYGISGERPIQVEVDEDGVKKFWEGPITMRLVYHRELRAHNSQECRERAAAAASRILYLCTVPPASERVLTAARQALGSLFRWSTAS